MSEHQFGSPSGNGGERNSGHRIDALGKILSTPRLHQATSRHEIHVHTGDLPCVSRKLAADLVAHDSFAPRDFRAPPRVGKQVVYGLRWSLEANLVLDGFTHTRRLSQSVYPKLLVVSHVSRVAD